MTQGFFSKLAVLTVLTVLANCWASRVWDWVFSAKTILRKIKQPMAESETTIDKTPGPFITAQHRVYEHHD